MPTHFISHRDGFPSGPVVLRAATGEMLSLDAARWHRSATAEERALLAAVEGPVIDVGCGPGRLVTSLAARRVPCLGIDSSPFAVALARRRRASVLQHDVFSPLPGEGRWATALLFDGNLGIGGDPTRLLARCRQLIRRRGRVLAEVEAPGSDWQRLDVRRVDEGRLSPGFAWAVVGVDAIAELAAPAGLEVAGLTRTRSGRWFASLARRRGDPNRTKAGR